MSCEVSGECLISDAYQISFPMRRCAQTTGCMHPLGYGMLSVPLGNSEHGMYVPAHPPTNTRLGRTDTKSCVSAHLHQRASQAFMGVRI